MGRLHRKDEVVNAHKLLLLLLLLLLTSIIIESILD